MRAKTLIPDPDVITIEQIEANIARIRAQQLPPEEYTRKMRGKG